MRSARDLYRLNLALAGLAAAAVLAGLAVALRSIQLGAPTTRLLYFCRQFLLPQVSLGAVLVLALGGLGMVVAARAVRALLRQVRDCGRFLASLEAVGECQVGAARVVLVVGREPEAFCVGLIWPRVCLSSAAVELLSPEELDAVIAHEAHHARRRDPLRILLLGVLAHALFFLPGLGRLTGRYEQLAEIAADEAAVIARGDRAALAAALLRFGSRGAPEAVGIASERVDHLLGEPPRWQLPTSLVVGVVAAVAGVLTTTVAVAHWTGPGQVNLPLLAAQSCMVVMAAAPAVALSTLLGVGWRMLSRRSPTRQR